MDKIRLLIVVDDISGRRGLQTIFAVENNFEVLGGLSLNEAAQKSIVLQPDVVLFDVPEDAPDFGSKISEIKCGCPCSLMLLMVNDDRSESLVRLLDQGLDGCIPKGIMRSCLVKIIELACQAGLFCLPLAFKKTLSLCKITCGVPLNSSVNTNRCKVSVNGEFLTRREMEILQLMAGNYSNRQIAQKLFISEPTVKTHVSHILRKTGQNNRAQAILYAYKMGLLNDTLDTVEPISK